MASDEVLRDGKKNHVISLFKECHAMLCTLSQHMMFIACFSLDIAHLYS